ncbi:hypothetical protein [Microbacterium sp. zg-YB36]|uniref:hypothetical protein n=1 Tax=Microbacterium sp. zg-YB36 TaxID=2969407 RepID=UPI00214ACA2E|nr:hypothetical protein [Microbacterium sp. zg-YB36]MDL5351175.1 hypothetical protein [Microbacterium sp. zg-YB36]
MSDYTPQTENVRLGYSYRPNLPEGERHHPPLLAEFDRWKAANDAQVAATALREFRDKLIAHQQHCYGIVMPDVHEVVDDLETEAARIEKEGTA